MLRPLSSLSLDKEIIKNLNKNDYLYVKDLEHFTATNTLLDPEVMKESLTTPVTLTALEHWQLIESKYNQLTTFSENLNIILNGGFQCGTITEITGAPESGKTQICLQISVSVQLSMDHHILNSKALYMDTRNGFSAQRIEGCQKLYPQLNFNKHQMMENISIINLGMKEKLESKVEEIRSYLESLKNNLQVRVLIIDSLTFRLSLIEDAWLKTSVYLKIMKKLENIASDYNIAVIVVSEQMAQIEHNGELTFQSAGGQSVASRSHKRLLLARIKGSKFAARLLKSPTMPQIATPFVITVDGVRDKS